MNTSSTPLRKGEGQPLSYDATLSAVPTSLPPAYPVQAAGYPGYPVATHVYIMPNQPHRRRSACGLIFKLFACTFVLLALGRIVHHVFHRHSTWDDDWDWNDLGRWPTSSSPVLTDEHQHPLKCIQGAGWTPVDDNSDDFPSMHLAKFDFELPFSSSKLLFFLSTGSLSHGSINVIEKEGDGAEQDTVDVSILVGFRSREALSRATVCSLEREEGQNGIGIFTPTVHDRHSWRDMLQFSVTVRLPTPGSGKAPLDVPALETSFHNFKHSFSLSDTSYRFGSVRLHTTNSGVDVQPMVVDQAIIATTNGHIHGSFNTSTSLTLVTTNAHVDVDARLHNANTEHPTTLHTSSTNGATKVSASLHSTSETSAGSFNINSRTSNGPLDVSVNDAPADSTLYLSGHTTNSRAQVRLPAAYEGTFVLSTTNSHPTLDHNEEREDPSGRGRKRVVDMNPVDRKGRTVSGEIRWSPRDETSRSKGVVAVSTTNGPVKLSL